MRFIVSELLPYVIKIRAGKRDYYYFRFGDADRASDNRKRIRLLGAYGSREFLREYERLRDEHAPAPNITPATGFPVGSLGWAIGEYKRKSPKWKKATASTQEVYDRRFTWLTDNYGGMQMAAIDGDMLRDVPRSRRLRRQTLGRRHDHRALRSRVGLRPRISARRCQARRPQSRPRPQKGGRQRGRIGAGVAA